MKTVYLMLAALALSACGTMQSIVKSSFPYTTTLTIAGTADVNKEHATISTANSFDQNFAIGGNDAAHVNAVRIISAKLESTEPSDFNIGQLSSVQVYVSKIDGKGEEMVASRKNINPTIGNSLVLDTDNAHFLDDIVRQPNIRVRMVYRLRNKIAADIKLHLVMNIAAYPNRQ